MNLLNRVLYGFVDTLLKVRIRHSGHERESDAIMCKLRVSSNTSIQKLNRNQRAIGSPWTIWRDDLS